MWVGMGERQIGRTRPIRARAYCVARGSLRERSLLLAWRVVREPTVWVGVGEEGHLNLDDLPRPRSGPDSPRRRRYKKAVTGVLFPRT